MFFGREYPFLKENREYNLPLTISIWKDSDEEFFNCEEMEEEDVARPPEDLELEEKSSSENNRAALRLENSLPLVAREVKVIRPRNSTLINSKISESNILPYSLQTISLLTEKDPLTYNQTLKSHS
ncbi:hypothetical protein O181_090947 [Austropuccinia psidii MF-1]|uniref:Uncharacterized protein n=1 Tax=Austropuccinia psidii MF-1 TaxID=1389203 RepID=A0A9Q3IWC1_9BASI|nr:hypothetical protein [Austropuccinia psidii MF-1]